VWGSVSVLAVKSLTFMNFGTIELEGGFKIRISLWCWTVWLERDIMLVVVARSCWFLDPFRVNGWSIHRTLDINLCCFYFFVSPDWVGIHFVCGLIGLGLCPPVLFVFIFSFYIYIYIYMNTWHRLKSARHSNSVGLSSIPFLCHWTLAL